MPGNPDSSEPSPAVSMDDQLTAALKRLHDAMQRMDMAVAILSGAVNTYHESVVRLLQVLEKATQQFTTTTVEEPCPPNSTTTPSES